MYLLSFRRNNFFTLLPANKELPQFKDRIVHKQDIFGCCLVFCFLLSVVTLATCESILLIPVEVLGAAYKRQATSEQVPTTDTGFGTWYWYSSVLR